jgi:exodeoxyribonuclease-3
MRIATFNVNGVNGRLPVLLRWLNETSPDIVCLQELKSETFPLGAVRAAGYEAIWRGQKSWNGVAILTRGKPLIETRRALPGDDDDLHSRYIEAAVDGLLIGCLYVPNGNPVKSAKFGFKLSWFERLIAHAAELLQTGAPIVLAGDYNVMPTELDVYKPERWVNDALFRIEVRDAFRRLAAQGWTDALRTLHPAERIYTFWDYFRNAYARDAGLRIDHLLLSPSVAARLKAAGVDRDVRGWEKASDHAPVWIDLADATLTRSARRSAARLKPSLPGATTKNLTRDDCSICWATAPPILRYGLALSERVTAPRTLFGGWTWSKRQGGQEFHLGGHRAPKTGSAPRSAKAAGCGSPSATASSTKSTTPALTRLASATSDSSSPTATLSSPRSSAIATRSLNASKTGFPLSG